MNIKLVKKNILIAGLLSAVMSAFTACDKSEFNYNTTTVTKPNVVFIGLTNATVTNSVAVIPNQLIRYNSNNNNQITAASLAVTGLLAGETIIAIDYRPATKVLYGISNQSRLYTIAVGTTAVATIVGTGPITPAISGSVAAFDFNPVADRLRVITSTGQNLRINPADATVTIDGAINGVANAVVTGAAYTNSVAGATSTVLYDLDVASQKLYRQDANVGTLTEIGSLGLNPLPFTNTTNSTAYNTNITTARNTAAGGFDISAAGVALAVFQNNAIPAIPINGIGASNPAVATGASSGITTLFQIDLATGRATDLGVLVIPAAANYAAASSIIGLAILP